MKRHQDATNGAFIWVAVEPGIAIRFNQDGIVDSMIVTGVVDTKRLRRITTQSWSHINPEATDLPTWRQSAPPDPLDVDLAHVFSQSREAMIEECLHYEEETGLPHPDVINDIRETVSGEFDDVDDFYKALAGVIQRIAPYTFSVNKTLAAALDITTNTAGQYVTRCRKRGYLPRSQRSKK